jgi:hypothetical protein
VNVAITPLCAIAVAAVRMCDAIAAEMDTVENRNGSQNRQT